MKLLRFTIVAASLLGSALISTASSVDALALRLELDRPLLQADTPETAIVKIALDGCRPQLARRAPVNLALVIDKSGSMSGEKIAQARQAALEAVDRLGADDVVSLVVYDNAVSVLFPAGRVGNGLALRSAIRGIDASGGTNLYGGVVAGARQLQEYLRKNYVHRVILLSDGQANVGPSSPAELAALGSELVRDGISVTTIGLGLDFNEDLMTRLAHRSDGNTYFVAESHALPKIFQEELGDVLNVVARRVVVEIEFPQGVRPRRLVGRDGRLEGAKAWVELNQLYAGQEKFALIEVELDPTAAGAQREIAVASVRYEDSARGQTATRSARVQAQFTRDEEKIVASANQRVQTDYAANRIAEAKDEVVALVDAGRREDAADRLRQVSASLSKMGSVYRNIAVSSLAAPAAAEADRVAKEGLDNVQRKSYRADATQTYNQQRSP